MNDIVALWNISFLIYNMDFIPSGQWIPYNTICALSLLISVYYDIDVKMHYGNVHMRDVTYFQQSHVSLLQHERADDILPFLYLEMY